MCGICGAVSSYLTERDKKVFKDLLRVSTLRGVDSTGVIGGFRVGDDIELMSHKTTLDAVSALKRPSKNLEAIFDRKDTCRVLIGHTRAATIGSVTTPNAHPFEFDQVIGVHNGTIHSNLENEKSFDTDSEALYNNINEMGLEAALLSINRGFPAYALVFIQKEMMRLNLIRNERRPLHFTYDQSSQTLFFASEAEFLRLACKHHNMLYTGQVFPALKPNVLVTIDIGASRPLDSLANTELKVVPTTRTRYWTGTGWGAPWDEEDSVVEKTVGASTSHSSNGSKPTGTNVVPITGSRSKSGNNRRGQEASGIVVYPEDHGLSNRQRKKLARSLKKARKVTERLVEERKKGFEGSAPAFLQPESNESELGTPGADIVSGDINVYHGYNGQSYTAWEMRDLLSGCCNWCHQEEDIEFIDRVHWLTRTEYICSSCVDNEFVLEYLTGTTR